MGEISNRVKILSSVLIILCVAGLYIVTNTHEVNVDSRITSDRRYMLGLDMRTPMEFDNTTFLVYDGDVLVDSDNVSRTIFREDTEDYQYTCYCTEKNWTFVGASTLRFVWYNVDNDIAIINITALWMDWSDPYGYGNYFIWFDGHSIYNEHSAIIMARID